MLEVVATGAADAGCVTGGVVVVIVTGAVVVGNDVAGYVALITGGEVGVGDGVGVVGDAVGDDVTCANAVYENCMDAVVLPRMTKPAAPVTGG